MKNDGVSTGKKTKAISRDVKEYWTPERRAKAKPVTPLPSIELEEVKEVKISKELKKAKPVFNHGARPTLTPRINPKFKKRAIQVFDPTQGPYIACGKLYFTRGGENWMGSASAIRERLLLTAGHCIYDDGEWSDNFAFFPAYPVLMDENGDNLSFASWCGWAAVFDAWQYNGDRAYDFGMIKLDIDQTPYIGYLGWMYGYSPYQSWKALGYPASPSPYDGEEMYEADGAYVGGDLDYGHMRMWPNNMHAGSSGGPWIATLDGIQVYANGVNSHHDSGPYDQSECSPYFDGKFKSIYDFTLAL
jgi:V8-like Glu-specific endopeptidase